MKCSVFIATSVDGYIARPDGSVDWLEQVARPGEDYGFGDFMATVDAIVMGRGTYDAVRGFDPWPYAGKRVIVLTHRPLGAREGVESFAGDVRELANELRAAGGRRVYVDGGIVICAFLAAGLVDDLTISMIPVVLGDGIRLFAGGSGQHGLTLERSRAYDSGLVQLVYQRVS